MITLYHTPKTRSSRFVWLLEELDADYQIKQVTIRYRDGAGAPDPANPHPHKKVPALEHDGALIFESAAIAAYLTDLFPKNGIGPLPGDPLRGPYLTYLAYYAGVTEPSFLSKLLDLPTPVGTPGWVPVDETMGYIRATLKKGPYLLGDKFSAADVLYGSTFALFLGHALLPKTPELEAYVKRCTERPAYARAAAKDGSR
jgi:glutathione S-transferase